jgi:hypothetical protein
MLHHFSGSERNSPGDQAQLGSQSIKGFPRYDPQVRNISVPPSPDWRSRLQEIAHWQDYDPEDFENLAKNISDEDAQAILNLQLGPDAASMPGVNALGVIIFRRWAEREPAEAAEWLMCLPENGFSHEACRQLATTWADKDLPAAVAWLKNLPENENKAAAQFALASEAAVRKDAVTAISLVTSMPPSPESARLLNYSVLQWATSNRENAIEWVKQVQDSEQRERLLANIAIENGIENPARAAEFAATALAPGNNQDNAAIQIVQSWARFNPEQAAAWVEQFPQGDVRDAAEENLMAVWAQKDLAGAGDWLNGLPVGRTRDAAVSVYAPVLASSSPEEANQLLETIQNQTLRTRLQEQLGGK